MLVLSRKESQSILLQFPGIMGEDQTYRVPPTTVRVTVTQLQGNRVSLGVSAPDHVQIWREEIFTGQSNSVDNQSRENQELRRKNRELEELSSSQDRVLDKLHKEWKLVQEEKRQLRQRLDDQHQKVAELRTMLHRQAECISGLTKQQPDKLPE